MAQTSSKRGRRETCVFNVALGTVTRVSVLLSLTYGFGCKMRWSYKGLAQVVLHDPDAVILTQRFCTTDPHTEILRKRSGFLV